MARDFFEQIDDFIDSMVNRGSSASHKASGSPELDRAWAELDAEMKNFTSTSSNFGSDLDEFDQRMKNLGYVPKDGPRPQGQSYQKPHDHTPRSSYDERVLALTRDYANLEVDVGSGREAVRSAYKKMLMKYHPDKFANDPAKQATATQITAKLNESYQRVMDYLDRREKP